MTPEQQQWFFHRLVLIPASKWNVHEKLVMSKLGLCSTDAHGAYEQLSILLDGLKKGNLVVRTDGEPTKIKIDLQVQPNRIGISCCTYGSKEPFERSRLQGGIIKRVPRYFSFGLNDRDIQNVILDEQFALLKFVQGRDRGNTTKKEEHQEHWLGWYLANDASSLAEFQRECIPVIAKEFYEMWDFPMDPGQNWHAPESRMRSNIVDHVATEIRKMIWCSLPHIAGIEEPAEAPSTHAVTMEQEEAESEQSSSRKRRRSASRDQLPSQNPCLLASLHALSCCAQWGHIC